MRERVFSTLCVLGGLFCAGAMVYGMLWVGYAFDGDRYQPRASTVALGVVLALLSQLGLFLVPLARAKPRPAGYGVFLFCVPWFLVGFWGVLKLLSSSPGGGFAVFVAVALVANGLALVGVGQRLLQTSDWT